MTETHAPAGSGFVHLTKLLPLTVTLARGTRRVAFGADEVEQRLELVGLASRLGSLLVEGGLGDSKQSSLSPNANADQETGNALAFWGKEGSGEPSGVAAVDSSRESEGFAHYLAEALGDVTRQNIAFYKKVARVVPRSIALDALGRAKDAQSVRKSRAHLFAFLVRDHFPKQQSPKHV